MSSLCVLHAQQLSSSVAPRLTPKNFSASGDIFGTRVFIENKGQFNTKAKHGEKILFGFENGPERIYFTSTGLIYDLIETHSLSKKEFERQEEGKPLHQKPDSSHFVYMNWVGADAHRVQVIPDKKQSHYFTYGEEKFNSNTFKSLTYKNIYPNIDIEFSIPTDHEQGLKYSVIIHAGANLSDYKSVYSGEVRALKKKADGSVLIKTGLWDIKEDVPKSYYENGEQLQSTYFLRGDTIAFAFPDGYSATREVIIDPWVAALSTFTANNLGYDVDFDFSGDMYVYGSFGYAKVAHYSNNGSLQWTFSGQIPTISWNSQIGLSGSIGNFAVDKISSKTYIGQGTNYPTVVRLNSAGNYDNFVTPINQQFQELWEMNFSCLTGDILIVGGGHTSNLSAATIATTTPVLVLSSFNPSNIGFVHDISAFTQDDFGNSFAYYACSNTGLNQKITRVNSSYNGNVWTVSSGYSVLVEINNKNNYGAPTPVASAGYNGLFANNFFLYYFDGQNLAAYNKATGAMIASTSTGNGPKSVGGIAVDNCNNIYVGGIGEIKTYSFTGTAFATLTPISLGGTLTSNRVFDIKLNRSTNQLFVSGGNFCGTYNAIYSNGCPTGAGICLFSQVSLACNTTSITCATLGSATIIPNNGVGPYSYTWVPSMQVGQSASNLAPGNHTVIVYDGGINLTYTTVTTLYPAVPLTSTISSTSFLNCNGVNNGTAAIVNLSGGSALQNFTWTNGSTTYTTASINGLSAGNYSLTIVDALTGCVDSKSFTVYQPPPLFSYIIASTPTACVGDSVSLTGITSGGSPSYTYLWNNGATGNSITYTELVAGQPVYTLTSTDANNCVSTALASVSFVPLPVISVANVSICPLHTGTLLASGASSYTWNTTTTGASYTDAPIAPTIYTVQGMALGCKNTATASISLFSIPTPTISSNSAICNGQNLVLNATGGITYSWQGPLNFSSLNSSPQILSATPAHSGIYSITVTAANSCTASASTNVTVHPTPTVSATGATICSTQNATLSVTSSAALNFVWSGPNGYSSFVQQPILSTPSASTSGQYTVTVFSAQSCSNTAIANLTVTALPQLVASNNGPVCESQSVALIGSNSSGGINFSWNGPLSYTSILQNATIPTIAANAAGIYTLTANTGPCINSATTAVVVNPLPIVTAIYKSPLCEGSQLSLSVSAAPGNTLVSYLWAGPMSFSSVQQFPTKNNSQASYSGIYTVQVTDTKGCSSLAYTTVSVLPLPNVTALGDTACLKASAKLQAFGAASYTWSNYMGVIATTPTLGIPYVTNVSPIVFTVIGTAVSTCTNSASALLCSFPLPTISAQVSPTAVCQHGTFTLLAQGAKSYNWQGPLDLKVGGDKVRVLAFTPALSGNYNVVGTDSVGCTDQKQIQVQVNDLPEADLSGGPFSACVPFCGNYKTIATKNSASLLNANWTLLGASSYSSAFNACFTLPGDYVFKGNYTDVNNCSNTAVAVIHAALKPHANFNFVPEHPVELEDQIQLLDLSDGENITEWAWTVEDLENGTSKFYQGKQAQTFNLEHAGTFVIALEIKTNEQCADTAIKTLVVENEFLVFVPNAFTPNHDRKNELFVPVLSGQKFFGMKIYDRWGQEIFATKELERGWDGTFKGLDCKEDVYVWKLDVAGKNGEHRLLTGHVTLYR